MKELKELQLNSRYGVNNRLIQVESDPLKYKLNSEYNYRVGFNPESPDKLTFIDPEGGPFITVGSKIEGHKVKAIYNGGIIEFES